MDYTIREHDPIPYDSSALSETWGEGLRLPPQKGGLDRWFMQWQWGDPNGYRASYMIGAQWLDDNCTMPLVVTPKQGCQYIDFMKIFDVCFKSGITPEDFSKIYGIAPEKPLIRAPQMANVLSPLIVVHFLSVVRKLVKRGLKKDYVDREGNLKKVKGHIDIYRNERRNIQPRRFDRVYCRYQEYSVNSVENRLIKRALKFARQILDSPAIAESLRAMRDAVRHYLAAFADVDDSIEIWEVKTIKHNKVFREYDEAVRLAKLILRRYDYSINSIHKADSEQVPPFWIDMSLLYEQYVLGLLIEAYGSKIEYQAQGYTGYPDFICRQPRMVIDTKYIPHLCDGRIDTYIVRQLSAYARDKKLFRSKPQELVPCVVIYPKEGGEIENPFVGIELSSLLSQEDTGAWGFYTIAVPLPTVRQ